MPDGKRMGSGTIAPEASRCCAAQLQKGKQGGWCQLEWGSTRQGGKPAAGSDAGKFGPVVLRANGLVNARMHEGAAAVIFKTDDR